ncbi:hypothetical protein [Actinopolyspora mzabensis]|uniref:hypothetical protein n=1 Tax=Actinopolyspora mzabensis TaxID=995066 RepID=UPI0015A37108|nr:hypothetical protein [Actinopolyspora mzabensis]
MGQAQEVLPEMLSEEVAPALRELQLQGFRQVVRGVTDLVASVRDVALPALHARIEGRA